ncbi:MAG: hypothetical protein R3D98_10010 [Candidatus Krumholzibacteriia bacterium]
MRARPTLCLLLAVLAGACAELPQTNDPPGPPVLESTGIYQAGVGVAVDVTCTDPDGDRVTIRFTAVSGVNRVDFDWTSFIASDRIETFYLGLGVGDWIITAVARDELDELGAPGVLELNVHP